MVRFRSGSKKKHIAQRLTVHNKAKSGRKHEKIVDHAIMLARKQEKQGETAWIIDAKQKLARKMSKHGITFAMIEKKMEAR
ncbi:MAG: hypothetical protein H6766_07780 [Candidatus Peribacteria bacterium]|nr:MAG: hypothetical protein H6766_07780 [Candidatus Peribacteria bacterium]